MRSLLLLAAALVACSDDPSRSGTDAALPLPPDAGPVAQGDEPRGVVAINEVQANAPGSAPDWIELVCLHDSACDLSGHYLSDAPDRPDHFYRFPAGTILGPRELVTVLADDGAAGAGHHAPFKLGREDGAYLLSPDGVELDALMFLGPDDGRSLARRPSGQGRFFAATPSPGQVNP